MNWKRTVLTGWGRVAKAETDACRPERRREAVAAFAAPEASTLIAYGGGRSYGDEALNSKGATILTRRLNRLLDFDSDSGLLVCESGVTFADLAAALLPKGWLAPVSPGTAFVTMGGAVANDVHGKNHDRVGSFGDHVAWIDLALPSGEVVRTSREEDPELFAATIGGVGLTGVIVGLALRMARVPSARMAVRERRMPDIDTFMATLAQERQRATYSVGWIDALADGRHLGRGILQTAEFIPGEPAASKPGRIVRLPVDLPSLALTRRNIGLFNQVYFRRVPSAGRERDMPLAKFFYPLDALLDWNRMYGRRGFHQFQCVIPDDEAARGMPTLLRLIAEAGGASFLVVLKTLGGDGRGHLSFPARGFTLALDFPMRAGTPELMARLERVALDHGGRVYLAKDACLSAEGFRRMYPKLDRFRAVLERVDPQRRLMSDLARRLRIREDA